MFVQLASNFAQILFGIPIGSGIKIEPKNKIYYTELLTKHTQPIFHLIMNLFEF